MITEQELTTFRGSESTPERDELYDTLGVRLSIPKQFLWGMHTPNEYKEGKTRQVVQALQNYGINFLDEHPVRTVLINYPNVSQIVVVNGHHRVRYAPKFGIFDIPCSIVTLPQLAKAEHMTTPELEKDIQSFVEETARRFGDWRGGKKLQPEYINPSVDSIEELMMVNVIKNAQNPKHRLPPPRRVEEVIQGWQIPQPAAFPAFVGA